MMDGTVVAALITGVCAATGGSAVGAWLTGRATAEKVKIEGRSIDAKLPAEVDSIAVAGAEAAVLVMDKALKTQGEINDDLRSRIAELEAARAADRAEIEALRGQVSDLRQQVRVAESHLADAREKGDRLERQLEALMNRQDKRK